MLSDVWEFLLFRQEHSSALYSIDEAKRSFYRAANAIFGKIGRFASEKVILHFLKTKCIPVLLYGLEAFPSNKSQMSSIDFVINRFFMKLLGRLKRRERKTRHRRKCRGGKRENGKRGTKVQGWKRQENVYIVLIFS